MICWTCTASTGKDRGWRVQVKVLLLPAVKYVVPDYANDLRVEHITIDLVLTADSEVLCLLSGDLSVVQLIPANILLSSEEGLK